MRIDEDIWKLMSRCVFNEASDKEVQQFQQLLNDNPSLQQQYDLISQVFGSSGISTIPEQDDYELQALNLLSKAEKITLQGRIETTKFRPVRKIKYWLVAASVAGLIAVATTVFYNTGRKNSEHKVAGITREGERKPLVLSDGTKVWLNAGSRLSYLPGFGTTTREVALEGEAFFDVTEDKSRPFVVHAERVLIKVLGTAFNVKAYDEDHSVTTSLYRGLVSITRDQEGQKSQPILLYPNQKLIVPIEVQKDEGQAVSWKELPPVKIEFLDSSRAEPRRIETSWIYNRLEFRGDDFVTLAHKMQHWFNVKIHFEDKQVQGLSFNGSFEKETIDQAMKALQLANSFVYKIENNEVFIYSAP